MISIVIITYNRSDLLIKTLKTILYQTFKNYEIIIVDDGSSDDTFNKINILGDNRIKYYNAGKLGNLSKLRNIGIKLSQFDYLAFCDDDDLWNENKLSKQIEHLKNYPLICTNANIIDVNDRIIKDKYFSDIKSTFEITKDYLLRNGNCVLTPSILLKKSLITDGDNYFDELKYTNYCEDYELLLRISKNNKFLFIDENLVSVRFHESISGGLDNNIVMLNSSIQILSNYKNNSQNKKIKNKSIEGILGFKILLVKLSFRKAIDVGISETFKFIFYISNPIVFYILFKKKILRKIKKVIRFS